MKKFLTAMLCLIIVLSAILMVGCKDESIFDGDYREVSNTEVSKTVKYFSENEESLIDWNKGLSVSLQAKDGDVELNINAKMASSILDSSKGVGEWKIEMKSNDRTETTQMIYDGLNLYKEVSFAGNTQKTKGKANFEDIVEYSDLEDFDDFAGEVLSLAQESDTEVNKKFYLDDSDDKNVKLKIEVSEEYDLFNRVNGKMCIVFDKNYSVSAIMLEIIYEGKTGNEEIYMTIEKWSGKISTPSGVEDYELVDNILSYRKTM